MRVKAAALVLAVLALSGCTEVMRTLTVSDVTKAELTSIVFQASDLPGYKLLPQTQADRDARLAELEVFAAKTDSCSTKADQIALGETFSNSDETVFVESTAEPTCGSPAEFIAVTRENPDYELREQTLASFLANQGVGLASYSVREVDIGLGSNFIVEEETGTLTYPGEGNIPFQTIYITCVSSQAALTVSASTFGDSKLPTEFLTTLAGTARAKLSTIDR